MMDGSLSFSLIAGLKHKLEKCVERRAPGILLNSGRSQLGSAYYFVFNYVPREPRAEYIYIHACVVKRRYNLIATAIRALSKCIRPRGDPCRLKIAPSLPSIRGESGITEKRLLESKSADPT